MRDHIADFLALETEPYGINPGDAASHRAFIAAHGFPFDLLVDEGRQVAARYGAIKPDGSGIQRTVVIVGKDGRVIFREAGAPAPVRLLGVILDAEDATGDAGGG